jgi:argininosuccinate lyase
VEAEDVHHFVEKALVSELGPLGWKLHTGRSRNELVATDFRLFVIDAAGQVQQALRALITAFLQQAKANIKVPMAGMTHMQHAQPILLSHLLLAHAEGFARDVNRLQNAANAADACPMGSGALAGCSFAVDRNAMARELGFSRITANSLDAVSDRDFALDYLFALAGIATHISRLAEDFVLFASQEFSYVVLPDEYSTGSSLMPQKKNPDSWELLRGKTGRITSALFSLFTTLKGLPTGYQRDLQEDKEALFAAHDQILAMLGVATGALAATKFREDRLCAAASNPALFATDAADYLVHRGVPFRQAHDLVGKVLREAEKQGKPWTALSLESVQRVSPLFEKDFLASPSVEHAIASKRVPGGTAEESVRAAIVQLEQDLQQRENKL